MEKVWEIFFDFWKLSGFYKNLMFFWELFEVLSWFEGSNFQKKRTSVKVFFLAVKSWVLFKYSLPEKCFLTFIYEWYLDTLILKVYLSEMLTHYEN